MARLKHYKPVTQERAGHLSVLVVDAEGDGGGVQQQPGLLLVHLLPQTLHAALTLRCFLNTHTHTHGHWKNFSLRGDA